MISPDESILICAVRYALGRMSYIVGDVANYVFYKRKTLSKECDERTWKNLLNQLKSEKEKNGKNL